MVIHKVDARMEAGEPPDPQLIQHERTWVDGPFAESKELIAGFSVLEVPTLRDAILWADRYASILVDSEVDVRRLTDERA